ncbi:MAG TPA: 3-deoxy-manno-octulosonate cytidylyltransferase, partial [Thermoguttaceae bacterium]|nr:3-deoxy-manno-octulosonate cytidylyltransferase [Thermoguttaceae bacterium]
MRIVVCIPARYASSRFPGKVLAKDTGKYLIQHTYEQAQEARLPESVLIAADDEKIVAAAAEFGGNCVLTRADHQSGTDRIAEATQGLDVDIVINVQGDEPEIDPSHIDLLAQLLIDHPDCPMATLATGFSSKEQVADPNVVKVIASACLVGAPPRGCPPCAGQAHGPAPTENGPARAIYFSRSAIPYDRDHAGIGDPSHYLRHIGIYAYRKDFLARITTLPQTPLEKLEKLEQLRVIEHGFP